MSQTTGTEAAAVPAAAPGGEGPSKAALWVGRVLGAAPVLMLTFSGVMKLVKPPAVGEGFAHLGWPEALARPLGVVELACVVLYVVPATSVVGAILVTGYMGGAIAAHVRLEEPFVVQAALGVVVWVSLLLREPRLRGVLPLRR
ncbi:MAG: DoxX family protein [Phycisphaerae bacterium]|nr:DoxX family protein [Phycisphaerae bacterium]